MIDRVSKLRKKIVDQNIEAMLVIKPENVTYLTGFTGTSGMLFITKTRIFLLTDFRYKEQASKEVPHVELCLCQNDSLGELFALVTKLGVRVVGFESHVLPFARYRTLKRKLASDKSLKAKIKPLPKVVEDLRAVKDAEEIKNIARATRISDKAFKYILSFIKPGLTEKKVALELEYFMRKRGAEKASFDIIVASGVCSSMPHARTSEKRLKLGEFVKLDFGAIYDGYCSDMTRTVVLGKATDEQRKIYRLVAQVQKRVCDIIKPGRLGKQIDKIARDYFEEKGWAEKFGHSLGHGVGLEIHESPTLGPRSEEVLRENMVMTIEPGLYFSGLGGVRIEDLIVLRKDGAEVLTKSPKRLIEI